MRSRDGNFSLSFTIFFIIFFNYTTLLADEYLISYRYVIKDAVIYNEQLNISKAMKKCSGDVQNYINLLGSSDTLLKGMTRRFLKKNHFIEKSDEEFRIYISERTEDYQRAFSQYLDEHYSSSHYTVSREELFESNFANCVPEMSKKIDTFFYRIRAIAKSQQEKVEKLEADIKDFI